MGTTIDKKIVEASFENDKFEKNISASTQSIKGFKKELDFDGVGKGLSGLSNTIKGFNISSLFEGITAGQAGFLALGYAGVAAITKVIDSIVSMGIQLTKALTIDPIKLGLDEYETKINAIQTILANTSTKGTTMDQVNTALAQLNDYADKTIYNFAQMTRNVGTFTAAGIDLDKAVSAIKGIANLAAVSGSNADQASTAMYQLSQALASGTVKLMDWNSVVNAGMGGQVFQDTIKETARTHGVAIDQMIKEDGSFRETLQRGWFTSEILTETLSKFTGDLTEQQLTAMGLTQEQIQANLKLGKMANDAATKVKTFTQLWSTLKEAAQSGWSRTWEIVIGDFEEAKLLMTEINDVVGAIIGGSAKARNELLEGWKDLGGREDLINVLRNAFEGVASIVKPLSEALKEIFAPITAKQLKDFTGALVELSKKFKIGEDSSDRFKRIFKGLLAVVDIVRMAIVALARRIGILTTELAPAVGGFLEILASIGDFIVGIRDAIAGGDDFAVSINNIVDSILRVRDSFKQFIKDVLNKLSNFKGINVDWLINFIDKLKENFKPLSGIADKFGKFFELFGLALVKVAPIVFRLGEIVAKGLGVFLDYISDALTRFEPERIIDIINGGLLAGVLSSIKKFVSKGLSSFGGLSEILDSVRGSLEAWQTSLKADALLKIAAALGLLALSIFVLSTIDGDKLKNALIAMTVMFTQLGLAMLAFQKVTFLTDIGQMVAMSLGLLAISASILIMAGAVKELGQLEPDQLIKGLLAILAIIGLMRLSAETLSKSSVKMIAGAFALVVFSFAIRSLAKAVTTLGDIDTDDLVKGLIGLGVVLTELAIFLKYMDLGGLGLDNVLGLLALAGAVSILVKSVDTLAGINGDNLAKGLAAIGVLLTELSLFVYATAGGSTLILTALGVGIIALAILALTTSMERLGKLSWEEIGRGLTAMAGALTIIGIASYLLMPTLLPMGIGLAVVAVALILLSSALTEMGSMSWDEVGRSMTVLAGSLTILAIAMYAMTAGLPGAAALLVISIGLMALAPALKILGSMSWEEIGRGLVALAGAIIILGIAGAVMTPLIPTLLSLGGAMLLVGLGMALMGIGLLAFSAGLAALAVSGAAGVTALVVIISSIISLVPMIVATLGRAILALVDVLVEGAPKLLEGIVVLLTILLDGLILLIPKLVDVVVLLIESILTTMAEKTPLFVKSGYAILIGFLSGVRDNIGEVAIIAADIIINFLDALSEKLPELIDAGYDFVIKFIDGLAAAVQENIPRLMSSVRKLGIAIIKGILEGVFGARKDLLNGIAEIGYMILEEFKNALGIHSPSDEFIDASEDIVNGLVVGLKKFSYRVYDGVKDMGDQTVSQFDAIASRITDSLNTNMDMNPTITPVIDFSNIDQASSKITSAFSDASIAASVSTDTSQSIASAMKSKDSTESKSSPNESKGSGETPIQFVQYNQSPKALSSVDIYRNTKNLLSRTRKVVGE